MVSTAISAGTGTGALAASATLDDLFLRLGLKWTRVANVDSWGVALVVTRLVGLPGETTTIRDGFVWANGVPLVMPESLAGLVYKADGRLNAAAARRGPAERGDDEFFVGGDCSVRATVFRWWDLAAEGHNPFAPPRSPLQGVATHTHWPRSRWKVHR